MMMHEPEKFLSFHKHGILTAAVCVNVNQPIVGLNTSTLYGGLTCRRTNVYSEIQNNLHATHTQDVKKTLNKY